MISLGFQKHCVFCLVFLKMCNNKKTNFNSLTSKLYYSLKVSSMGEICPPKKCHMTILIHASISVRHNQDRSDMRQQINLTISLARSPLCFPPAWGLSNNPTSEV